jgi:hypothetical protein
LVHSPTIPAWVNLESSTSNNCLPLKDALKRGPLKSTRKLMLLAGDDYVAPLIEAGKQDPLDLQAPMRGLSLGNRFVFLNEAIRIDKRRAAIALREVVGVPAVRALDGRCFMLGFLDRSLTEKNRGPVAEMTKLVDFCETAIAPTTAISHCTRPPLIRAFQAIHAGASRQCRWLGKAKLSETSVANSKIPAAMAGAI